MKKHTPFYILLMMTIMFLSTVTVNAKELNSIENIDRNLSQAMTSIAIANYNSTIKVPIGDAILGDVNDPDSVAWLLQKILDYTRIIGPFIVLIMSSLDYLKAILSSDDDSLKNAHKNLSTRLILVAALFLLPTLVSVLLSVLGLTSNEMITMK